MRDQFPVQLTHEDVDTVTGVTETHRGTVIRLGKQRPAIQIRVLTCIGVESDVRCLKNTPRREFRIRVVLNFRSLSIAGNFSLVVNVRMERHNITHGKASSVREW